MHVYIHTHTNARILKIFLFWPSKFSHWEVGACVKTGIYSCTRITEIITEILTGTQKPWLVPTVPWRRMLHSQGGRVRKSSPPLGTRSPQLRIIKLVF